MSDRLREAVQAGSVETVRALVMNGEDVNEVDDGSTALTWAVEPRREEKQVLMLVECLLDLGAKVTVEGSGLPLGTSVHRAAWFGYERVLRRLLSADGCSALGLFDDTSRTPLICAIMTGNTACVRTILKCSVDVNAHDTEHMGDTALHMAVEKRNTEIVELLLKHGADPTIPGWMQITPLDEARELSSSSLPDERRISELVEQSYQVNFSAGS